MAEGSLGRWNGWPPPKVVKAGIYSLYIKRIVLTRLGTESGVADLFYLQH